jgi:hypothetical protein
MAHRAGWIDGPVDVLLAALDELGMTASRRAAVDLINERVSCVASQMGTSTTTARRYLTDDAVQQLARTLVFSLADETPGADILAADPDTAVPMALIGSTIAGLAEASRVRFNESDHVDEIRSSLAQLAQSQSAIGQILIRSHDHDRTAQTSRVVMLPFGLVNRIARQLRAAAVLVDEGVLPDGLDAQVTGKLGAALRRDADRLRDCIRGAPQPPSGR